MESDYERFLKEWNVEGLLNDPFLSKVLREHVEKLITENGSKKIFDSISFAARLEGQDKIAFLRLLASACAGVVKGKTWLDKRRERARKNLKMMYGRKSKGQRKIKEALNVMKNLCNPSTSQKFNLTAKECERLHELLARIESSEFFTKRSVMYERGLLNMVYKPSLSFLVFLFDAASRNGTRIPNYLIEHVGYVFVLWGFEKIKKEDVDAKGVGQRLRQQYRLYAHKYPGGYPIATEQLPPSKHA